MVSSSIHWRSDGRNLLDREAKSGDSTKGYGSRGRDSSYFGLFLAFGLLFWDDFGTVLCHGNGMGGFVAGLKGCFQSKFGLKICIYGSFQNAPATL